MGDGKRYTRTLRENTMNKYKNALMKIRNIIITNHAKMKAHLNGQK